MIETHTNRTRGVIAWITYRLAEGGAICIIAASIAAVGYVAGVDFVVGWLLMMVVFSLAWWAFGGAVSGLLLWLEPDWYADKPGEITGMTAAQYQEWISQNDDAMKRMED